MTFDGLSVEAAKAFTARWLPAWTGNRPDQLVAFYSDDTFYSDPAIPQGVHGRAALVAYFTKLLARNPNWVWTNVDAVPMQGGFLNKWHAAIPVGERTLDVLGVCSVQLRDGLIIRNEVYFDRAEWMRLIEARRSLG